METHINLNKIIHLIRSIHRAKKIRPPQLLESTQETLGNYAWAVRKNISNNFAPRFISFSFCRADGKSPCLVVFAGPFFLSAGTANWVEMLNRDPRQRTCPDSTESHNAIFPALCLRFTEESRSRVTWIMRAYATWLLFT